MKEPQGFKKLDKRAFLDGEDGKPAPTDEEAPGEVDAKPTYVAELEARAAAAEAQLKEYIKAYKEEVEGGLEKVKDRLEREAQRALGQAMAELALRLLEVLDNFDRSLAAAEQSGGESDLLTGLRLIREQFFGALQELGISAVPALGEPFDPQFHEAAGMVPVEESGLDNHVVEVLAPGYLLGDRLVRPALVQVGRASN